MNPFVATSTQFTLSGVIPFNSPGFVYVDAYVVAIGVKLLVNALLHIETIISLMLMRLLPFAIYSSRPSSQ